MDSLYEDIVAETGDETVAHYYAVTTLKFIIFSLMSLGLYCLYWQYRNWVFLKAALGLDILPFWRALFSPIWVFSLFKLIDRDAEKYLGVENGRGFFLAALYVFFALTMGWAVLFIPVLLVNWLVTRINAVTHPALVPDGSIHGLIWLAFILIVSSLLLVVLLVLYIGLTWTCC